MLLLRTLLGYAGSTPAVIITGDGRVIHGLDLCKLLAQQPEQGGITAAMVYLSNTSEEISAAFADGDWLELLDAAQRNFMAGSPCDESYIQWLKDEIEMRSGSANVLEEDRDEEGT